MFKDISLGSFYLGVDFCEWLVGHEPRWTEKGIFSCYHLHHNQIQGKEQHPTLYLYRHRDKPYHLDYCFASADMADKIQPVEIVAMIFG